MKHLELLIQELKQRLPELDWLLSKVKPTALKDLPQGLFRVGQAASPQHYIQEIKRDLERLAEDNQSFLFAYELVKRIEQKISVLVNVCQAPVSMDAKAQSVEMILSYHEWIKQRESKLKRLRAQKQALELRCLQTTLAPAVLLDLQKNLGQIERTITELEEIF